MSDAIVVGPGDGTRYEARGSEMLFKATAGQTAGAFSFMVRDLPPHGTPPPAHKHDGHEAFFVLDGTIEFRLGPRTHTGETGTFVYVPPGAPHTFANTSDEPARLVILHAPAMDAYFRELEVLWAAGEPSSEDVTALMSRHGMEPA